jgi:hypothetical protein
MENNTILLTEEESTAVERAYYESMSFENLVAILARNLNVTESAQAKEMLTHYADQCRKAKMRLALAQNLALEAHGFKRADHPSAKFAFDFVESKVRIYAE